MPNTDSSRNDGLLARMPRYPESGWIAGVCAGLADYSGWSVKLIRVLFILAFIFGGFFPAGVVYLLLWYLMDAADGEPDGRAGREAPVTGPSSGPRRGGSTVSGSEARARFERLDRRLAQMEACVANEELELRREFRSLGH